MTGISNELHFKDRIVPSFKIRHKNFWEAFLNNTQKFPKHIAVSDQEKKISYKEMLNLALKKSIYYKILGLQKGDRVCVLFENSWPLLVCILAALKDGIIIVPLNPKSSAIENEMIISDCLAKCIVFDNGLIANLPSKEKLKSVQNFCYFDEEKYSNIEEQNYDFKCNVKEEEISFILYTSGTTGKPKGAMITNFNIIHSCMHFQKHFSLTEKDNSILVVPASHITGLIAHIMTMFFTGGTLILMKSFDVKVFLNLAEKEALSYLIMVPAMYNLCLHREDLTKYKLSNWRIGCFGGAPMPLGTIKKLAIVLPNLKLVNAYGSTETCSPSSLMPLHYDKKFVSSVGKVVETGKILIMNNNNKEVPNGDTGEIWVSGPMVIPGYWNDTNKTAEEFIDGYWKSGDIGYKDKHGYIYVLDRKKDVINRGGYKIYSSEIENLLSLTGLIIESAIIPYKDPILGEKIHAVIYANKNKNTLDDLKKVCLKNLSEYKQPDYWTFLEKELPKNKNGKVLKSFLIDQMNDKF